MKLDMLQFVVCPFNFSAYLYTHFISNNKTNWDKEKGYLEEESANITLSHFVYRLSTQGRFYKEYRLQCFIHDIFVPAIVAVVTSLITYFLCG